MNSTHFELIRIAIIVNQNGHLIYRHQYCYRNPQTRHPIPGMLKNNVKYQGHLKVYVILLHVAEKVLT